jgi:nitrate/nitrite transporter NarK
MVMGVIGLLLAPVLAFVVRDKPRAAARSQVRLGEVFRVLARKPTFWLMAFAASMSSLCGYGLALWTPSVLMRSFGLDIIGTANFFASLIFIGGSAGVFAGGWLADRLGQGDRRWFAWLPAIAWLITGPMFVAGFLSPDLTLAWLLLLIPNALNILWLGPVTTAVQNLVAQPQRATASASFLLINNFIGLGLGPLFIGALSDSLTSTYGVEALRYAAVATTLFYVAAGVMMLFAARRLPRDWVAE